MSVKLELLRQAIAAKLIGIECVLPKDYALTLVARHRTNPDAHIVVTAEGRLADVTAAIERLYPELGPAH